MERDRIEPVAACAESIQFPSELLRQTWFLAGPTASGKTSVALELATRINAEIVSLDSMSLYRGMDIGTAKPSISDRNRVPHHLIDVLDPNEEFSLAEYVSAARVACESIQARGKTPLFVGGTGLYLRGVLRGVFSGPPADWDFRHSLQSQLQVHGIAWLHEQLRAVDAASAETLHPNDTRRVIRALEVQHITGTPLSSQQHQQPLSAADRPPHVYWLSPPRAWLRKRIDQRAEDMIRQGLVEEVRQLSATCDALSRTAGQALGYREVIEHLNGARNLAESVTLIQNRTRQFAKRQHTWFRNLVECREVEIIGTESPRQLAEQLTGKT
ncbi:MAG: tRNA (adenosine(37)-N6)-dimethylallyltransferase MiaA [Planctomycetota bacterium]|nr:tRNA (adenosine(37)-N6)-dimethylallyltransferase MiaA [Planctomycetota bacterium]